MRKQMFFGKRLLSVLLTAALFTGTVPAFGEELSSGSESVIIEEQEPAFKEEEQEELTASEDMLTSEEEPEEEIHYIKGRPLTEEERAEQLLPMKNLKPLPPGAEIESNFQVTPPSGSRASFPRKYDARKEGVITPVKNQNPYGACWAFAMASLMETSLLSQGAGLYDLSEEHLCYFFSHRENDPLGNTGGDKNHHVGYNWMGEKDYHEGGNDSLAALFLSTWSGMANERDFPLLTDPWRTEFVYQTLNPADAYKASAYLEDSVFSDYSVQRMKELLMEYKSVSIMYNANDFYLNPDTAAYSCPSSGMVNHVVTVVGWDDNYSYRNFNKNSQVKKNGAWIVKNSWGTEWGDQGYFYLSYEDKSVNYLVSATATAKRKYPNNYFYDGSSSYMYSVNLNSGDAVSAVFKAKAGKKREEILGEVSVFAMTDDNIYSIQIYKNLKDPKNPESGVPAYSKPVVYRQTYAGYDTVAVPETKLEPGSTYSVVIKNQGKNFISYGVESKDDYGWCYFDVATAPGQGFSKINGRWSDLHRKDAYETMSPRIKAHTRTGSIRLNAPKSLTAKVRSYNRIDLSWTPVPGCDGYTIYRQEGNGEIRGRASVKGEKANRYIDRDVQSSNSYIKPGVTYTYHVRAFVMVNGKRKYSGNSPSVSARTKMDTTRTTVRTNNNIYNTLSWNQVGGAEGYYVYRRIPGQSWECIRKIENGEARSYRDRAVKPLETYQYMVRAYRTIQGREWHSPYHCSGKLVTAPELQRISAAYSTDEGIQLTWESQNRADGYRVYRIDPNGTKRRLADVKNGSAGSFTDKTAEKGQTYTYYVQAFVKEFYGTVFSQYRRVTVTRQ